MKDLDSLWLKIDVMPGANIPARAIPDLIKLAERLGCTVKAECNGVTVLANPGDDPIDLAVAWEQELRNDRPHKVAAAWTGREHRVRHAAADTSGNQTDGS